MRSKFVLQAFCIVIGREKPDICAFDNLCKRPHVCEKTAYRQIIIIIVVIVIVVVIVVIVATIRIQITMYMDLGSFPVQGGGHVYGLGFIPSPRRWIQQ